MSSAASQPRLVAIAPAASDSPQPTTETLMPYTCTTCTRRKVKCDKLSPVCTTCRKSALECVYQAPAPRKRKRKPVDEMSERLEHYESLLKQSGILPATSETPKTDSAERTPVSLATPAEEARLIPTNTGRLHASQGRTRYINGSIWRNLDDLGNDYQTSSDEDEEDNAIQTTQAGLQTTSIRDPFSSAILGPASPATNLIEAHPTYEDAMKMWNIYVKNIDPVCKVLHVPTTRKKLQRAASNPSSASKAMEAVLFAVYNIAIESTTDEECEEIFQQPRSILQPRYLDAVRQALVNAQFLRTSDLNIVQAYILFLLSMRSTYDPHTFWILTGVAVRLGQRLGLHLDGVEGQLNPFDVQIRRRVFWQMLPLDGMASQGAGTGIALPFDAWDTRQPLNINDTDIWPDMPHAPEPREGATDMLFCLARTELAKFLQKSGKKMGDWARIWAPENAEESLGQIRQIQDQMEAKYIRFCDITDPMHCLTMLMARSSSTLGNFRLRMPRTKMADASDEDRREQWNTACKWLDTDAACNENPLLKGYRWHLRAVFQWEPIIWILYELRRDPARFHTERIWARLGATFGYHPEILDMRRSLHVALGRLALKAWDTCCKIQSEDGLVIVTEEPPFLATVREALERRNGGRKASAPVSREYNPFDPAQDATSDLPEPNPADFGVMDSTVDLNFSPGMDLDTTDWMFWDQLIHDPSSFDMT